MCAEYLECPTCGNYSIEVIGDETLGCEICLNEEEDYEGEE